MLRTAELDIADTVTLNDVNVFLDNAAWTVCSTYHTVPNASPGAAIFGQDMLFDILFVADWHRIGEQRQSLTNRAMLRLLCIHHTILLPSIVPRHFLWYHVLQGIALGF